MSSDRRQAWTRYWRSGALHSCVGSYDGNYGGAVAAFWRERFSGFGPDARVLDLATGNGPLPLLMRDSFGAAALPTIDAVDFAEPHPAWAVPDRIRFHGDVRMEALPFDDASFDAVFSQYGFEYAERDHAIAELVRVAKPDARIALVCHHAGSQLVTVARAQVEHTDWLDSEGLLTRVRDLLPLAEANDLKLRAAFNEVLGPLASRAQGAPIPDALHDFGRAVAAAVQEASMYGVRAGSRLLERWIEANADARLRSAELVDAALDHAAVDALAAALEAGGHPASVGELSEGRYLLGWTLVSR